MKNVLEFLERTEKRYPHETAVDDGRQSFTWRQLLCRSRQLGSRFAKEVEPGRPVVILAEKSAPVLAAMFGAVYAGCFYVMIDPAQPAARIREILRVVEPGLIVIKEEEKQLAKQLDRPEHCYILDGETAETEEPEVLERIRQNSREDDRLYCIFTSGSTGTPKGVVVSHQAVIRFIRHFTKIFQIEKKDIIGNQAPFDFDVSVKDIYSSICTGAKLVLIPKSMFSSPPLLLDYLCEKKTTVLIWAVSALCLVTALKGLSYRVPERVRLLMFSGEVMPVKQLRIWQAALPTARFVNLYGPSEITCNCTYYPVTDMLPDGEKLSIGHAFPGRTVFLADETGNRIHQPGVQGEICVSGESLAEGYYRNEEETKKRFVWMQGENGLKERCYKTGDMGYYGEEGELYFSGRKDFQIKHMGHRIELEEIDRAIEKHKGVERSCCMLDGKRNRLLAFYMGEALSDELRRMLKKELPAYMIPHKFVKMDLLPVNKNGKTDRQYFRQKMEAM